MEANTALSTVEDVKAVLVETLGIEERAAGIDGATSLSSFPELDSLAVAELLVALEERFGAMIDGEDVTAEAFETLGSLAALVERNLA